jgi:hypothetical protein
MSRCSSAKRLIGLISLYSFHASRNFPSATIADADGAGMLHQANVLSPVLHHIGSSSSPDIQGGERQLLLFSSPFFKSQRLACALNSDRRAA